MAKETKQPVLLKYLIANIQKGIYPSEEELTDIQNDLGVAHLSDINVALLSVINSKEKVPQIASKQARVVSQQQATKPRKGNAPDGVGLTPSDVGKVRLIGRDR